jgi:hypothetical protein
VNYTALKGGASNFNGTSKHRGLAPFAMTNSASVGSTGDSRRYHTLRLKADVFGCVYIPIVQDAALKHAIKDIDLPRLLSD